jgi:mRNA interferase RelE/StbE
VLKIQITKRVYKFLDRLPLKPALQLKEKLQGLRVNPSPQDSRLLIGYPNYRRVTVGEYRIIYSVEKDTLLVFLIGKRNDGEVYKKLKQIL